MENNSEFYQETPDLCKWMSAEDSEDTMDRENRKRSILERTGHIPVVDEVGQRRWRWIGRTLRRNDQNIARQALRRNPQGQRRRGRPQMTWRKSCELEANGHSWSDLTQMAQDRDGWRMFIRGLYPAR